MITTSAIVVISLAIIIGGILKTAFGMSRYIIAAPIAIVISALAWGVMISLAASRLFDVSVLVSVRGCLNSPRSSASY